MHQFLVLVVTPLVHSTIDIVVTKRYPAIEFLATAGRHYSITVILSSQISNTAISPPIRINVDYVFWRKLGKDALQTNVFPYMSISDFQDYKQLHQFTIENTHDYQFVFYNNNNTSRQSHWLAHLELPAEA